MGCNTPQSLDFTDSPIFLIIFQVSQLTFSQKEFFSRLGKQLRKLFSKHNWMQQRDKRIPRMNIWIFKYRRVTQYILL